jgi:hypothetical protein
MSTVQQLLLVWVVMAQATQCWAVEASRQHVVVLTEVVVVRLIVTLVLQAVSKRQWCSM